MRFVLAALIACILARSAAAQSTCYPSTPVSIMGMQGRPIQGAKVTVTVLDSATPKQVFSDPYCTVPLTTMPLPYSINILQFYSEVGAYTVKVEGEGLVYTYAAYVALGSGSGAYLTSIDRPAETWILDSASNPPALVCAGGMCSLNYNAGILSDSVADTNFITPRFPVALTELLFEWQMSGVITGVAKVRFAYCVYENQQPPCVSYSPLTPELTLSATSLTVSSAQFYVYPYVSGAAPSIGVNQHVRIKMIYVANQSTLPNGQLLIRNMRLTTMRQ